MRNFFLAHPEYTHFVICPDDLLIKPDNLKKIKTELEKFDYANLAGVCNVDLADNKDYINICRNLPHPTRTVPERGLVGWRAYQWYRGDDRFEEPIFPVPFLGFACQAINRKTMQALKFQDDSKFNRTPDLMTGAIDVMWANQCAFARPPIKQHVDVRNRMKHLKFNKPSRDLQIGDGELRLYPKHKDIFEMIYREPLGLEKTWVGVKGSEFVEGVRKDD